MEYLKRPTVSATSKVPVEATSIEYLKRLTVGDLKKIRSSLNT